MSDADSSDAAVDNATRLEMSESHIEHLFRQALASTEHLLPSSPETFRLADLIGAERLSQDLELSDIDEIWRRLNGFLRTKRYFTPNRSLTDDVQVPMRAFLKGLR